MRKQVNVTIDGFTYQLSQLGAVEGRELVVLFVKLLGRFAPMLASAVKSSKGTSGDELSSSGVVAEIAGAIGTLDPKELEPLWDAFARQAMVLGKDGKSRQPLNEVFDDHFAGEYFSMVRFFIEAAKLNFGDFLSRALAQSSATPAPGATP
jgi:hypothetical protein